MSVELKEKDNNILDVETKNTSNDALISIRDLHVWFELKRWGLFHAGYVKAVDGVNFDLHAGESIGVVGESGCGKTTLMRTILGLIQPIKGEILFEGDDLSKLGPKELQTYRAKLGYVQQDPYGALPPFMDLHRIIEEPMIIHGVNDKKYREQRIREVVDEVKM